MSESEKVEKVARALWNEIREDEDRCDLELEDMGKRHRVWDYARAAIAALDEHRAQVTRGSACVFADLKVAPKDGQCILSKLPQD